ncbi:MAG: GAF domain-containing protein [Frateuria sp.]|nr:GAF domain-containing protein [Frateuria sp.]
MDSIVHHLASRTAAPEASRLLVATAEGADSPLEAVIPALLATVKHTLNMDVAFVSEFVGDCRVFKYVVPATCAVIAPGGADPLEASWCKLVVDGKLPQYMPDPTVHCARGDVQPPPFPIGTHLSVPITLDDGHHFGTLCCFSFEHRPEVREGDLDLLHAIARLLAAGERRRRTRDELAAQSAPAAAIEADVAAIGSIEAVPQMLEVICRTTGMGFAAVARVTETQWVCCASRDEIGFGLHPGGELVLETTLCNEIRQHHAPVAIDDVPANAQYCEHHTPARYGFRSYISVPIFRSDRSFWGTLCAIDPEPAKVETAEARGMFRLFADLVGFHLDANDRLRASESALRHETDTARRREQFVAALGHDIRTPLQAIAGGLAVIERAPDQAKRMTPLMRRSLDRISELVQDLMDLARGQLGTGMRVTPVLCDDLGQRLARIVDETRAARPDTRIEFEYRVDGPVWCDPARIVQVAANLLGNAVTHGTPGRPIAVRATASAEAFELTSSNVAPPLSPAEVSALFKPYFRPATNSKTPGLGLGLYIVSEIAKAHRGTATASAESGELTFTVRIPGRA